MDTDAPKGLRYSQVYLDKGEPVDDAPRMRGRIGTVAEDVYASDLVKFLARELGVNVIGHEDHVYSEFFKSAKLRDVLDAITLIHRRLTEDSNLAGAEDWRETVGRILTEENSAFELDPQAGVHRRVDGAFQGAKVATIAALGGPRYANTLVELNGGFAELDKLPPDGKQAIRRIFSSAEGLFKLMFPRTLRLAVAEAKGAVKPRLDAIADPVEKRTTIKLFDSFCDWIDAAHNYRHEAGVQEPAQPPIALALLIVSQGIAYLRWLAEIDRSNTWGTNPRRRCEAENP